MRIFEKFPLPWNIAELPNGGAVIQDATYTGFIAEFDDLIIAEWALGAMMLAQGTNVDIEEPIKGA